MKPLKNTQWLLNSGQTNIIADGIYRVPRAVRFLSGAGEGKMGIFGITLSVIAGLCLIVSAVGANDSPAPDHEAASAMASPYVMAWSAPVGSGWEIFFSRTTADGWAPAIQVSANGNRNLVPSVVSDKEGTLWLFWSSQEKGHFLLYHARVLPDDITAPEVVIEWLTNNMAPSALVDESGTLWLVWSGFDGSDDDIFFSKLEGSRWRSPRRVNRDDDSPDIQPLIGLDTDGIPWVVWRGFDNGTYRFFFSKWNGRAWENEKTLENDHAYLQQIRAQLEALPDMPDEVDQPMKGSIHAGGAPIQSLPLFFQPLLPKIDADPQ